MTNGLLLPAMWDRLGSMGLKYIIISFDSLSKEIYEKQRGCSFEKALAGIDAAVKMMEKYSTNAFYSKFLSHCSAHRRYTARRRTPE